MCRWQLTRERRGDAGESRERWSFAEVRRQFARGWTNGNRLKPLVGSLDHAGQRGILGGPHRGELTDIDLDLNARWRLKGRPAFGSRDRFIPIPEWAKLGVAEVDVPLTSIICDIVRIGHVHPFQPQAGH